MANKRKKILALLITLLCAVLIYNSTLNYRSGVETLTFSIEQGQSVDEIANNLKKADLISSTNLFKLYIRLKNLDQAIFAGQFSLSGEMNLSQIAQTITEEPSSEIRFTILEGQSIRDIDENLAKNNLIQAGDFIKACENYPQPLEGYLYPDTYFLHAPFTSKELIEKALENFHNKVDPLWAEAKTSRTFNEIIIMASIIENEVFTEGDRPIVSGIFWKRLDSGWQLGADATLLYITEDRTITATDLALESPYNTRKNLGLPPTPISNPSLSSIKAALNPKESPYWFYLTTLDTGEVIYAKTNEEHNLNRAKHL